MTPHQRSTLLLLLLLAACIAEMAIDHARDYLIPQPREPAYPAGAIIRRIVHALVGLAMLPLMYDVARGSYHGGRAWVRECLDNFAENSRQEQEEAEARAEMVREAEMEADVRRRKMNWIQRAQVGVMNPFGGEME